MGRAARFPPPEPEPSPASVPVAGFSCQDLVERIRAEFIEQPGLRRTEAQGGRLWRLDLVQCRNVLSGLVNAGFLARALEAFRKLEMASGLLKFGFENCGCAGISA